MASVLARRSARTARTASGHVGAARQQLGEHHAVLERRVHALAVERHDGVRGIADQQHAPGTCQGRRAPCRAVPADAAANSAGRSGMQRAARRETRGEERAAPLQASASASKLRAPVARQEQRRGEAAVGVRQRDQHEAAARPDVQRVRARARAGRRARRECAAPCSRDRAGPRVTLHRSRRARRCAARSRRRRRRSWA